VPERAVTFGSPLLLLTLAVPLAAVAAYVWLDRRPPREAVAYPNFAVLAAVATRTGGWKRHVVAGLILLAIAALCVGVARPRLPLTATSQGATVVLVVDVSLSMNATDVSPSRLAAARAAITRFADRSPGGVRVALVAFSDEPVVLTPPTTNRKLLQDGIEQLSPGFGTAIGDAVARGVELARTSTAESGAVPPRGKPLGAVVLLSDGAQTRGLLTPAEGARLARRAGVPVYTISLGTLNGSVAVNRGGTTIIVPVPPDRQTLAAIAEETGGKTFAVTDAARLNSVYEQLGTVVGRTRKPREITVALVGVATALLAAALGLGSLWAPRLP
jgi:Ca-activated chloride channel family protein